jgi:hypothetical protein
MSSSASFTRPLFEAAMRVLADKRYEAEIKRFAVVPERFALVIYVLGNNGTFMWVTMDALMGHQGAREAEMQIHYALRGLLHRIYHPAHMGGEYSPAARRVYENLTSAECRDVPWGSWEKGDQDDEQERA